jgi:hypothetical protein
MDSIFACADRIVFSELAFFTPEIHHRHQSVKKPSAAAATALAYLAQLSNSLFLVYNCRGIS